MDTHHETANPANTENDEPWATMYRSERKKSRILGATTVAASLLAVGMGAWGLNNAGDSTSTGPGQFGPGTSQISPPGTSGNGSVPGPMSQDLAATLLNSDGSVNADAVTGLVARMPSGALDQMLSLALANGSLTQDQADAILAAAGAPGSGMDDEDV